MQTLRRTRARGPTFRRQKQTRKSNELNVPYLFNSYLIFFQGQFTGKEIHTNDAIKITRKYAVRRLFNSTVADLPGKYELSISSSLIPGGRGS